MASKKGTLRPGTLMKIYTRDNGICHLCGLRVPSPTFRRCSPLIMATCDHILPKIHGGTVAQANLKLAHRGCNMLRGSTSVDDWRDRARDPQHNPRFLRILRAVVNYYKNGGK